MSDSEQSPVKRERKLLNQGAVLAVMIAYGILLCTFLSRCYMTMPWDEWTISGVSVAYWRKPIAAGLMAAGIWGIGLGAGCLFWWLLSWVTGASWASGLRRVWENIANASLFAWMTMLSLTGIMATVVFPWADRARKAEAPLAGNEWFFNADFFIGRLCGYFFFAVVIALIARKLSLRADRFEVDAHRKYERHMRMFSAIVLPFLVIAVGLMAVDWIGGLRDDFIPSILPLSFLGYVAVSGLALSAVIAAACLKHRDHARTGLEQGHLGALLLVAVLFKGYFCYGQLMITQYAGIPREMAFYANRLSGDWGGIAQACAWGGIVLPIVLLLLPAVRKNYRLLAAVGGWLVAFAMLEAYWVVGSAMGIDALGQMAIESGAAAFLAVGLLTMLSLVSLMVRNRCFAVDHDKKPY